MIPAASIDDKPGPKHKPDNIKQTKTSSNKSRLSAHGT